MGACKGGGETWHSQLSRLIDYQKKFLWWWKCSLSYIRASQVVLMVKNHLPMQEMWVWSLCREDPLEKEIATHSSILVWKIPWTEETGRLHSMGLQRVGHDWATSLSLSTFFMVHLSQSYMTTREIIALTIRTFVGRVISLLALDWAHAMPKVIPTSSFPTWKITIKFDSVTNSTDHVRPDCTSISTPGSPRYMYIKSQVKYHGQESGNL